MSGQAERSIAVRRFFRRGPWENAAMVLIGLGVVMLMQPLSIWLYGHSFPVILAGTIGFVIVSHFPEE
jgi:L-lactate permease